MTEWFFTKARWSYPPDDDGSGFIRLQEALGDSVSPQNDLEGLTHMAAIPMERKPGEFEQRCVVCCRVLRIGSCFYEPGNLISIADGVLIDHGPDMRPPNDKSEMSHAGLPDCEEHW